MHSASKKSEFQTAGQVAKTLRVSVSTLKRWLGQNPDIAHENKNANGWRLFSIDEIEKIRQYQRQKKRMGKTFKASTLMPHREHKSLEQIPKV